MPDDSVEDLMKDAWQALLRGDLAERDRLCKLAEERLRQQAEAAAQRVREVAVQAYREGKHDAN